MYVSDFVTSELNQMQRKLDRQAAQLSKSEQIVRELQSHESDMQEALAVKDSQFSLLRKRFDESEEELVALKKRITELQAERDKCEKPTSALIIVCYLVFFALFHLIGAKFI